MVEITKTPNNSGKKGVHLESTEKLFLRSFEAFNGEGSHRDVITFRVWMPPTIKLGWEGGEYCCRGLGGGGGGAGGGVGEGGRGVREW